MKKKTAALSIAKHTLRNLSENQPGKENIFQDIGSLTSGSVHGGGCCAACGC